MSDIGKADNKTVNSSGTSGRPTPSETLPPKTLSEAMREERSRKSSMSKDADTRPIYKKKEDSVKYSIRDGLFTSIKTGLTDSYVMPFAIALNATNGMLSILSSVPALFASFMQLFAQGSLKFFKTRGNLIFWTAFVQAFMWLPLLLIPLIASGNVPLEFVLLILFVTLEATIGTFQGPIYNSILGDLIDENKRGEFFGKRNRMVNVMGFVSTMVAGFLLSFFRNMDKSGTAHYVFFGFGILFFLAFCSRLISSYFKSKIYSPPYEVPKTKVKFSAFLKNMTHNNYGIFVLYVFMFRLVASISAPFFALYLLRDMQMSYIYYTLIVGIAIVASFVTMGLWGKLIDKRGSKFVLTISGFMIPLSPLLLILGIYIQNPLTRLIYILCEEAFSGAAWAAFNLSTSSFLFDATAKDERVKYISYYNFLIGIAVFLGAVLGGLLIKIYHVWIISAIPFIFLTTGVLRLLVTSTFIHKVREAKMVEIDFPGRGFFHRVVTINPRSHSSVEIIGVYENDHQAFHNILPPKRITPIDGPKFADKKSERAFYEHKTFEYYKENALKTLEKEKKK